MEGVTFKPQINHSSTIVSSKVDSKSNFVAVGAGEDGNGYQKFNS